MKIGFAPTALIGPGEIASILKEAVPCGDSAPRKSLSPSSDGAAVVTVSPDNLAATLFLRKGRGGGKPLTLAIASDAIRLSKVRRYTIETIRKDLQEFFKGTENELVDYQLASGQAPERGKDGSVEWLVKFLPVEESDRIRAFSATRTAALPESLPSRNSRWSGWNPSAS